MSALGTIALIAGLVGSVMGALNAATGLARNDGAQLKMSFRWASIVFASAVGATIVLEIALLSNDFSFEYVAANSNIDLPLMYKISVLWASLEGSLVLWVLVLTGYVFATAFRFRDRLDDRLLGFTMLTLFVVAAFFFGLLVGPADPMQTLVRPPLDGNGPNPLLQNHPLMAIHPIMLYLGYVGFTVPFAFAIGALATGRVGEGWLLLTRAWTVAAWGFLTVGIILGGWWSYEVLGWGGYWAWDPVENVSFLPWLTATAFLHSVVVQERRGMLRVWNLSLIISTFALTILGTFVTRSGVLDSVHEFSESSIGPVLLAFFGVIVVVSFCLIAWRMELLRTVGTIESPLSREGSFVGNNLLFTAFAFVVLLGTMFPLLVEALNNDQLSVGSPYFNRLTAPIGLMILFLMGVSPLLPWRSTAPELLRDRAFWPAVFALVVLAVAVVFGADSLYEMLGYLAAGFAMGSSGRHLILAGKRQGWRGVTGRAGGGMVAHLGLAILALGFIASSEHGSEVEARLKVGDVVEVAGHTVEYVERVDFFEGRNEVTQVAVLIDNDEVHRPAITRFATFGTPIGTPSVATGWRDDVYVSVLDVSDDGSTALIRVIVRPLITWLWTGGLLMGFGALLAMIPHGSRKRTGPAPASVETNDTVATVDA